MLPLLWTIERKMNRSNMLVQVLNPPFRRESSSRRPPEASDTPIHREHRNQFGRTTSLRESPPPSQYSL